MYLQEIKGFLTPGEVDIFKKFTIGTEQYPWTFSVDTVPGVASESISQSVPGVSCDLTERVVEYGEMIPPIPQVIRSKEMSMIVDMLRNFKSRGCDASISQCHRIRFNVLFNSHITDWHKPHVDSRVLCESDKNHWVCIIHLFGDGPTYIFDKKWGDDQQITRDNVSHISDFEPGKATIFDGRYYHASSSPIESPWRMAININLS